jgi:hypothetical protein
MRELLRGPEATARLVPSGKPLRKLGITVSPRTRAYFRPGKKAGEIVQRQALRIVTPGEVSGISLRGIASRKGKFRSRSKRRRSKSGRKSTRSLNKSLGIR